MLNNCGMTKGDYMKRAALFLLLTTFFCQYANAGCDMCIKAAAEIANAQMTASINATTAAVNANVAATNALNASVQATNVGIQASIEYNNNLLLQGMDASTNRIEISIQQNTKASERSTEHIVKTVVNTIKEVMVAEEVDKNNRTYSAELAQPLSGDIGANRAPLLKKGMVQSSQVWKQMTKNMHDWNNNTDDVDQAGNDIKKAVLLTQPDEVWDPQPLLTKRQLTLDESKNQQKLLTMIANPVPLKSTTDSELSSNPAAAEYEFKRRIYNTKIEMAHAVLASSIVDRHPLIPISTDDWQKGYVTSVPDPETGSTSMLSLLESETIGKISSDGWYLDVKTKTEAGVLRELVYQQAINNVQLTRLIEDDEQELMLLSLLLGLELEKNKPRVPNK